MSTESPQPTDSDTVEEQAFHEMVEHSATRRGVLRGIGATGTAAIGVGVVGADEEEDSSFGDDIEEDDYELVDPQVRPAYDPDDPDTSTFATARNLIDYVDRILQPEGLPEDEIQLHSMGISESEGFDIHLNQIENDLERTSGLASDEARHAIATAWEDGLTEIQAHQNAMQAIRDYYSKIEWNHLEVLNKSILQLRVIMTHAVESDDVRDHFIQISGTAVAEEEEVQLYVFDETTESKFELTNGDEVTVEIPAMEYDGFGSESEVGGTIPIDQDLFDLYDDENEEFVFEHPDEEEEDVTTSLDVIIQSVQVGDDPSDQLDSAFLLNMNRWMEAYYEIEYQSDRITANFDEQLVEDMYELMDADQLSPSDVRGINGLFNEYSGDSEVTSSSLNLAIYNRLDMEQPNLETTASMEVTYTGPTEREVTIQDGDRNMSNSGFVEDQSYTGLLYAEETPEDGLRPGHSYQIGETSLYTLTDDGIHLADAGADSNQWSNTEIGSRDSDIDSEGETLYVTEGEESLYAFNAETGRELWEYTHPDIRRANGVALSHDDQIVFLTGSTDQGEPLLQAIDPEDQSLLWDDNDRANEALYSLIAHPSEDMVFYPGDGYVYGLDSQTGDLLEGWPYEGLEGRSDAINLTDDGTLIVSDWSSNLHGIDINDPSETWTQSYPDDINDLAMVSDNRILLAGGDGVVRLFDLENGEPTNEIWTYSGPSENAYAVEESLTGDEFYAGYNDGELHTIESEQGLELSVYDYESTIRDIRVQPVGVDLSGILSESIFYDAPTGDEISLIGGHLTIDSMQDADGNEISEDDAQHWEGGTEYDVYDSSEFAEYTQQQTELIEQIENNYVYEDGNGGTDVDVDLGWPDWMEDPRPDIPEGSALVGVAIVGLVVVSIAWSVVSDLIPGLGN